MITILGGRALERYHQGVLCFLDGSSLWQVLTPGRCLFDGLCGAVLRIGEQQAPMEIAASRRIHTWHKADIVEGARKVGF
jgi:hypothetical protein